MQSSFCIGSTDQTQTKKRAGKKYFKWKDGKRSMLNRNWNETTCVHKFKSNYVVRIGSIFVSVHFLQPTSGSSISASLTLSHTNNPNFSFTHSHDPLSHVGRDVRHIIIFGQMNSHSFKGGNGNPYEMQLNLCKLRKNSVQFYVSV